MSRGRHCWFPVWLCGMRLLFEPNQNQIEDLPRNSQDVALIGDPRNDENTIVGQIHLLFLHLHNKLGEQVAADDTVPSDLKFEETQRRLRWHYQWVVIDDYLRRIVGDELLNHLFSHDPATGDPDIRTRYYRPRNNAYMPAVTANDATVKSWLPYPTNDAGQFAAVRAMAVAGGTLYMGGDFTRLNGNITNPPI